MDFLKEFENLLGLLVRDDSCGLLQSTKDLTALLLFEVSLGGCGSFRLLDNPCDIIHLSTTLVHHSQGFLALFLLLGIILFKILLL